MPFDFGTGTLSKRRRRPAAKSRSFEDFVLPPCPATRVAAALTYFKLALQCEEPPDAVYIHLVGKLALLNQGHVPGLPEKGQDQCRFSKVEAWSRARCE